MSSLKRMRPGFLWLAAIALLLGCEPTNTARRPTTPKPAAHLTNSVNQRNVRPAKGVKRIPIPQREHGYKHFESMVLTTNEELRSFLEAVAEQPYWNHKTDFVAALTNANIDFDSSSLVLIRSTAGSISIKVTLTEPMLSGNSIVFRVHWDIPGAMAMMMNYNCFAVTVPKGTAANVRIVSEHEKNLLLPLPR